MKTAFKTPLALMLAGVMLTATPAFADMHEGDHSAMAKAWFEKIDTNSDGKISKEEHDSFGNKMFAEADTSGDGSLTLEELKAQKEKEKADAKAKANPATSDHTGN